MWAARRYSATPRAGIGTKKRGGLGMTVEKRDKRIVLYLTESENELVTRAAARRSRWPRAYRESRGGAGGVPPRA